MSPYLGMPVIVPARYNNDGQDSIALVSRVWDEDSVSVRVLDDSNEVGWRPGIKLLSERPDEKEGEPRDMNVCWPLTFPAKPSDPSDTDVNVVDVPSTSDDDAAVPVANFSEKGGK